MRLRLIGAIILLVLLVATVVVAAQHLPAAPNQGRPALTAAESVRQVEDTVAVCAVIIGGTSLLAGLMQTQSYGKCGRLNETPPIRSGG